MNEERIGNSAIVNTEHEPIFRVIHGFPGTGKSKAIAWICELFTDVLGWEHGNNFVCLAVQNTMASNIGGYTIHHWGSITFKDDKGREIGNKSSRRDTSLLFHRCMNLRWMLIDEISMVSAELLAELEYLVKQAMRPQNTYKKRRDKSIRPFGGVNTLLLGDWSQLRPVRSTALFDHPKSSNSELARTGLLLLWGQDRDSAQGVWELLEQVRCPDEWYQVFSTQCRNGNLALENYFFIHGVPTESPGSAVPAYLHEDMTVDKRPKCGNGGCAHFFKKWKDKFMNWKPKKAQDEPITGKQLMNDECNDECEICKSERKARAAVAKQYDEEDEKDERFGRPPFDTAPYIHQLNVPKHAANVNRAMRFSENMNRCVHWIIAHDFPLHPEDQARFFLIRMHSVDEKRLYAGCNARIKMEHTHTHTHIYIYIYVS